MYLKKKIRHIFVNAIVFYILYLNCLSLKGIELFLLGQTRYSSYCYLKRKKTCLSNKGVVRKEKEVIGWFPRRGGGRGKEMGGRGQREWWQCGVPIFSSWQVVNLGTTDSHRAEEDSLSNRHTSIAYHQYTLVSTIPSFPQGLNHNVWCKSRK